MIIAFVTWWFVCWKQTAVSEASATFILFSIEDWIIFYIWNQHREIVHSVHFYTEIIFDICLTVHH